MTEIEPAAHHRAAVMHAIFQNGRPRARDNRPEPCKPAEQMPVLAITQRLIETAGAAELRVADQHDAAIDDKIASEQVAQDLAARLAATAEQAAAADATSAGVDPLI